jgi:hypothetical protein
MKVLVPFLSALRWFAIVFSLALLAACTTPYQPMSAFGGYHEIQLAPDIYRVMFFGNGYTNSELAVEYALRRCAELTAQNGYRYFGILAVNDFSAQSSFTIPGSAYTTGNLQVNQFGNTAFGTYTGHTFITPAQTVQFNFPRPVITIKMFNAQVQERLYSKQPASFQIDYREFRLLAPLPRISHLLFRGQKTYRRWMTRN